MSFSTVIAGDRVTCLDSKHSGVFKYTLIVAEKLEIRKDSHKCKGSREVDGIQRPDRLDREKSASTRSKFFSDLY
jgi:hypothetical protein